MSQRGHVYAPPGTALDWPLPAPARLVLTVDPAPRDLGSGIMVREEPIVGWVAANGTGVTCLSWFHQDVAEFGLVLIGQFPEDHEALR